MNGNGIPRATLGNGEGFTTLILTDAESRLIRKALSYMEGEYGDDGMSAYNRGIQRATARIKSEFDAEQKRRKEASNGSK